MIIEIENTDGSRQIVDESTGEILVEFTNGDVSYISNEVIAPFAILSRRPAPFTN